MGEFLSDYGFFILVAALLVYAYFGSGRGGWASPYAGPRRGAREGAPPRTRASGGSATATGMHPVEETGGAMHPLDWKVMTWSLGLFGAVTFVVCVVYGLLVPRTLHMTELLEMVLPGFRWLTAGSFVLGLVESFLYGAYAGLVFTPIHNVVARRLS